MFKKLLVSLLVAVGVGISSIPAEATPTTHKTHHHHVVKKVVKKKAKKRYKKRAKKVAVKPVVKPKVAVKPQVKPPTSLKAPMKIKPVMPVAAAPPKPKPGRIDVKTYIPVNAAQYFPTLNEQIQQTWVPRPYHHYFGGLIEQESCISLTHSRCWSPTSRLKTSREEGAGLGQLTRAYRSDGSIRFDALADSRRLDPRGLNELRWDNVYQRPDLQMRVIILMTRANWNSIAKLVPDDYNRLAMADAAYNGGLGGVMNERRACAGKPGCDPNIWFGNVEKTCLKSTKPIYGNRSACMINREHVTYVLKMRMDKYRNYIM